MKKILFLILAAFCLAAAGCGKGGDGEKDDKQIELPNQNESTQQAHADEESAGGFTFTAKSSWTASVTESTRASSVSWLRLLLDGTETYSGGAGTVTLTIELDANYSGADRKATITIICGDDKITVTVEQKGTTQSGEIPEDPAGKVTGKLPKKITMTSDDPTVTVAFSYDSQDRLTGYVNTNFDGPGTTRTAAFSYEAGKVTANYVYTNADGPGTGQTVYTLNGAGSAVSMTSKFKMDNETEAEASETSVTFSYDAGGYLSGSVGLVENEGIISSEGGGEIPTERYTSKNVYVCTWTGGNITKSVRYDYDDVEDDSEAWTNIEEQQISYTTTALPASVFTVLGFNCRIGGVEEPLPIFGKLPAKLPKEQKWFFGHKNYDPVINYSRPNYKTTYAYTWDGGDLVKMVETRISYNESGDTLSTDVMTYVFEY